MTTQITIFEKILAKEIPVTIIYEDEFTLAFKDIHPEAPIHVLVIPKIKLTSLNDMDEDKEMIMGKVLHTVKKVAKILGIENSGYRSVINTGSDAGQSVFYIHCHVLGGRSLDWPPG